MKKFLIFVLFVVFAVAGYFAAQYFINADKESTPDTPPATETQVAQPKVFTLGYGFEITLDDSFSRQYSGSVTNYAIANSKYGFMAFRESFQELEGKGYTGLTEEEYAELSIESNNRDAVVSYDSTNRWYYFEYTATNSGEIYNYYSIVLKGQSGFWVCTFFAKQVDYTDATKTSFKNWLKTITINDAQYA